MTTFFFTDILEDPDAYVESIKENGFYDFNDGDRVFKNVQQLNPDSLTDSIGELLSSNLVISFARMSPFNQEEPNFIHKDDMHGDYTAIIYLNKDYPDEYGTTLYDEDSKELMVFKGRYNSLFIFPSSVNHSRNCFDNFGTEDDSRLVQVMFFKLK